MLLLSSLALVGLGCGDDSGTGQKIDAAPDMSGPPPDMSSMPGYDKSKGGMTPPPGTKP